VTVLAGAVRAGGTERYLRLLLGNLDRTRVLTSVVLVTGHDVSAEEATRALGSPTQVIRWRAGGKRPLAFASLVGTLRRTRPDCVYCLQGVLTLIGPLAARLAGVPTVLTAQRNMGHAFDGRPLRRTAHEIVARTLADGILVNAEAIRSSLLKNGWIRASQVHVLPNPLDPEPILSATPLSPDQIHPLAGDLPVITQVGRLTGVKNQAGLIRVADRLRREGREAIIALVGSGPDEARLRRSVEELELQDRVVFLGDREDVPSILKASTLTVLPSLAEGTPYAVLESLVAGIPVVAACVGGVPEVLFEESWLVTKGNQDELENAIRQVLSDPGSARLRARDLGRQLLRRHDAVAVADSHGKLFRAIHQRTDQF
jgi:starch synthase (maltosyl-transferring)